MASFSSNKITPANGQKIPAVDGQITGYMKSDELKAYILSALGQANGIASLDSTGKLVSTQLPDMANDVLAFDSIAQFPVTGADGVLYIDKTSNALYRWDGTQYVSVSADTSELEQRVEELEAENAQQAKDIAMLKYANEGRTYIIEESDRDGYTVDVEPSTVMGEAFGEAVLKSVEGRDVVVEGQILNNNLSAVRSEGRNLADISMFQYGKDWAGASATSRASAYFWDAKDGASYSIYAELPSGVTARIVNRADASTSSTTKTISGGLGFSVELVNVNSSQLSGCKVTLVKGSTVPTSYTPYRPPVTLSLPSVCSSLHGVGTARDKVSFVNDADGKRWLERKMGMVDLGSLNWEYSNANLGMMYTTDLNLQKGVPNEKSPILCARYATIAQTDATSTAGVYAHNGNIGLVVNGSGYTAPSEFKSAMAGVMLLYPLATPQLLDITDLGPEEPSIPIEDGGTLTFVNENKVATPFTMSMPVKLGGAV